MAIKSMMPKNAIWTFFVSFTVAKIGSKPVWLSVKPAKKSKQKHREVEKALSKGNVTNSKTVIPGYRGAEIFQREDLGGVGLMAFIPL